MKTRHSGLARCTLGPAVRRCRRGLGIVEAVISLAVSSALLVAVGAAFNSSSRAVQVNEEFFRATQASRVTMNQVLTELRRAASVQASADTRQLDVIRIDAERTPDEIYRRYAFDPANRRATLQVFYGGGTGGPVYTMASNVESATFGPGETAPNSTVVVSVPVRVQVRIKENNIVLHGSAGPRRAG